MIVLSVNVFEYTQSLRELVVVLFKNDLNENHTDHQVNKTIAWELKSNYKLIAAEYKALKSQAFYLQKLLPVPY